MTCYEIWNLIGQWISGAGTIIVAIVLGYITYKLTKSQETIEIQNLKIQLFKERYDIYKQLEQILRSFTFGTTDNKDNALGQLVEIRDKVQFLFDEDIHEYLLLIINNYERMNPYNYGQTKDDDYYELIKWFGNQHTDEKILKKKFSQYLDLRNYGLAKR